MALHDGATSGDRRRVWGAADMPSAKVIAGDDAPDPKRSFRPGFNNSRGCVRLRPIRF